jgi:hypothetical protein
VDFLDYIGIKMRADQSDMMAVVGERHRKCTAHDPGA